MFNKQTFVKGEVNQPFVYHDKLRVGVVEEVADKFVTIKFDLTPRPGVDNRDHEFKSFNYHKMKPVS